MAWDRCALCGQESCATVHMTVDGHDFTDQPADPWVWHRAREEGRVHGFPPWDGVAPPEALAHRVSLCALVVVQTDDGPTPTDHDPTDRCGRCQYRAREVAR